MDATIKAKWLEDLRSGNFRKGTGVLHRSTVDNDANKINQFCCLGVLCEQAVAEGVIERRLIGFEGDGTYEYYNPQTDDIYAGDRNYLPVAVRDWAGLSSHSPEVHTPDGSHDTLACLNDESFKGDDFGPIADLIEHHLDESNDPVTE